MGIIEDYRAAWLAAFDAEWAKQEPEMAIATGGKQLGRIVEALGLKYVRSLHISAETDSAVAIVTEQYVTENQLDRLAGELETKEWVLVPKDEWVEMQLSTGRQERQMGTLKRRIIEEMEPKEEPPMGHMKDFDIRIRQGGDDAIAAVSELMPRWIPVSERLPDWGDVVMVYYYDADGGSTEVAAYIEADDKGPWACEANKNDDLGNVTHWMPLPDPPEVK